MDGTENVNLVKSTAVDLPFSKKFFVSTGKFFSFINANTRKYTL